MNDNPIEKLYSSLDYCKQEIIRIREVWSNKNTFTLQTTEQIEKVLSLMYLYCPEDFMYVVIATIEELETRKNFLK